MPEQLQLHSCDTKVLVKGCPHLHSLEGLDDFQVWMTEWTNRMVYNKPD